MEENKNIDNIEEKEKKVEVYKNENPEFVRMKEDLENTTDRLKRLVAEFDNFKKRNAKEREMLYGSVLGDVVVRTLTSTR